MTNQSARKAQIYLTIHVDVNSTQHNATPTKIMILRIKNEPNGQ
jgi:hypothetical protein